MYSECVTGAGRYSIQKPWPHAPLPNADHGHHAQTGTAYDIYLKLLTLCL